MDSLFQKNEAERIFTQKMFRFPFHTTFFYYLILFICQTSCIKSVTALIFVADLLSVKGFLHQEVNIFCKCAATCI